MLRFAVEDLAKVFLAAPLRARQYAGIVDPDEIGALAARGDEGERPLRVMELDRSAGERAAKLEIRDERRLRERMLAGVEPRGGADQRLLAVGADDKRRAQLRPVGERELPDAVALLDAGERSLACRQIGQAGPCGFKCFGELDVRKVPAEGRQAELGGVK